MAAALQVAEGGVVAVPMQEDSNPVTATSDTPHPPRAGRQAATSRGNKFQAGGGPPVFAILGCCGYGAYRLIVYIWSLGITHYHIALVFLLVCLCIMVGWVADGRTSLRAQSQAADARFGRSYQRTSAMRAPLVAPNLEARLTGAAFPPLPEPPETGTVVWGCLTDDCVLDVGDVELVHGGDGGGTAVLEAVIALGPEHPHGGDVPM